MTPSEALSDPAPTPVCQPAGLHLPADLHGVDARHLRDAAHAAGAHILLGHFHTFGEGGGVTGVLLLAESHISIHTWPETGFAAADIFMCGATRPELALQVIQAALAPAGCRTRRIERARDADRGVGHRRRPAA